MKIVAIKETGNPAAVGSWRSRNTQDTPAQQDKAPEDAVGISKPPKTLKISKIPKIPALAEVSPKNFQREATDWRLVQRDSVRVMLGALPKWYATF